jgi:hypothetical protein
MASNSLLTFFNSVQTVFSTVNRASTDATNVRVNDMVALMAVYSASETSTLKVVGGSVFNNNPDNLWIAVDIDRNSIGNVVNTTFVNNVNTEYVFSVENFSTLTLEGAMVTDSQGGTTLVSTLAIRSKNFVCTHCMLTRHSLINRTLGVRVLLLTLT